MTMSKICTLKLNIIMYCIKLKYEEMVETMSSSLCTVSTVVLKARAGSVSLMAMAGGEVLNRLHSHTPNLGCGKISHISAEGKRG